MAPAEAVPAADATRSAPATRWRAHAFGLTLISDWPLVGFPEREAGADDAGTELVAVPEDELQTLARRPTMRLVREIKWPSGDVALTVHHDAELGYLVTEVGVSRFLVAPDAGRIRCATDCREPSRWQRRLLSHALPIAATLRGMEVLHASGAALGAGAVGFVGRSSAGKTSVALNLVRRGAAFVADDALAVELRDGAVFVHPGPPLANFSRPERERLAGEGETGIGRPIADADAYKSLIALDRADRELPLVALYVIERDSDYDSLSFVPLGPDPVPVLASTSVLSVRTPERLANQLDVCTEIARTVPLFAARMPLEVDAGSFATAVQAHVETLTENGG